MVRVTHLVRDGEEPFPGHPAIVLAFLAAENDVKTASELVGRKSHYLVE